MYPLHGFLSWHSDHYDGFRKLNELPDMSRIYLDISILATRANAIRWFPGDGSVWTYLPLDVFKGVDWYDMPSLPLSLVSMPTVVLWPRWMPVNRWNLVMSSLWFQRLSLEINLGQNGLLGLIWAQRRVDWNERARLRSLLRFDARVCPKPWDPRSLGLFKGRLCRSIIVELNRWKINFTLIARNLKW